MSDHKRCRMVPDGAKSGYSANVYTSYTLGGVGAPKTGPAGVAKLVDARDLKSRAVAAHVFWQSAAPLAVARSAAVRQVLACDHERDQKPPKRRAKRRQHPQRYGEVYREHLKRGARLTAEQRAERRRLLVRLYLELGCPLADCAALFGVNKSRVAQILKHAGVTLRPRGANLRYARAQRAS